MIGADYPAMSLKIKIKIQISWVGRSTTMIGARLEKCSRCASLKSWSVLCQAFKSVAAVKTEKCWTDPKKLCTNPNSWDHSCANRRSKVFLLGLWVILLQEPPSLSHLSNPAPSLNSTYSQPLPEMATTFPSLESFHFSFPTFWCQVYIQLISADYQETSWSKNQLVRRLADQLRSQAEASTSPPTPVRPSDLLAQESWALGMTSMTTTNSTTKTETMTMTEIKTKTMTKTTSYLVPTNASSSFRLPARGAPGHGASN